MSEPLRYEFRTQLASLLPRLRQTVPLPLDPKQVYMGAFSPQVAKWFSEPVPAALKHHNVGYRNLLRATARQTIIHFNLADPSVINDHATNNPDQPFWIRMEDVPVCPSSKVDAFLLDAAVRNDPMLQSWYRRADLLEMKLRVFHDKIYQIAPMFGNRTDIALAWPEVARAVPAVLNGLRGQISDSKVRRESTRVEAIRAKIETVFSPEESASLVELLATAVLLPSDTKLMAWVGINREDE